MIQAIGCHLNQRDMATGTVIDAACQMYRCAMKMLTVFLSKNYCKYCKTIENLFKVFQEPLNLYFLECTVSCLSAIILLIKYMCVRTTYFIYAKPRII